VFGILEIKCIAASDNNGIFPPFAPSNKMAALHKGATALSAMSVAICGSTRGNGQVLSKGDSKKIPLGSGSTVLI
jgi:hypothetical protein